MISRQPMHPALYRAYQFFVAVKASLPDWAGGLPAHLSPADARLVKTILPDAAQQRLFSQMPPNDQRHAIAVVGSLQRANRLQPALLQAALLHDVAKSIGQPIPHRVAIVLFEAFWPQALQKLSKWRAASDELRMTNDELQAPLPIRPFDHSQIRKISRWRRPFVVHAWHPQIGAAWARQAGCDALAINLILRHQDRLSVIATEEDNLLAALQWADNLN